MHKNVVVVGPRPSWEMLHSAFTRVDGTGLSPNTVLVDHLGDIYLEINEWGLIGSSVDSNRRQAVVWGDSVVFASGMGWVSRIEERTTSWQFLNGGVPGDEVNSIVDRAIRDNRLYSISLNILFPGWHPSSSEGPVNSTLKYHLERAATTIPNLILGTMPTCLSNSVVRRDISANIRSPSTNLDNDVPFPKFINNYHNHSFKFWGSYSYSKERSVNIYHNLVDRNNTVLDFSSQNNIPCIDLFKLTQEATGDPFDRLFYDVCHPRPSSYDMLAESVYREIRRYL